MQSTDTWSVCYKRAYNEDGSLLFPERLTEEFLQAARRTMGSYLFANQYLNEIIPLEDQTFKPQWLRYWDSTPMPEKLQTYAFIDPAISEADTADYTATVVVSVDCERNWYLRYAERARINPSQIIEKAFSIHDRFKPRSIGIEDVAFQRALLHFGHEEMRRRGHVIPLTGVKRGSDKTKEMRILGLVPRFEWGSLLLARGFADLELELAEFPRGSHDDILDALASIENIVSYPAKPRKDPNAAPAPNSPDYERWYIQQLTRRSGRASSASDAE